MTAVADVFEPDNDPDHASLISIAGTPQLHSIHQASDVDWVKFTLQTVSRVTLETNGASGDTKLWLFHADKCNWSDAIAYDYDSGQGCFSKIDAYLEPGEYRAAATEEYQDATIDSYQLSVTAVSLADKVDSHEPDNTAQTARPLTANAAAQSHTIHTPQDVDWYSFTVTQASRATLNVGGASGKVMLRLYGPTDSTRLLNYDYGNSGISGALAQIVAYIQPGTYWASVAEYYGKNTIDNYSISLAVVAQSDLQDAYEQDNLPASAKSIPIDGTPQQHNIHQPADADWVTFQVAESSRVTIETNGLDGATYLQLYGPGDSSRQISYDYTSGNGDFSRIIAFLDPGAYWAKVTESGQNATIDSYIVSVDSARLADLDDAYENDSTWDKATNLVADAAPQVHNIHRPTDVDWFRVQLSEASRVILETDGVEGNTWMALYAASNLNSPIASDSYSGNGDFSQIVEFVPLGTYYVKVQENYQDATIDRYTIGLQTTPLVDLQDAYEPDDSQSQARNLVFGAAPESHNIHTYRDVDWYKFTLQEGCRSTLETDGLAGDVQMRLYRSDNLNSALQTAYSSSGRASSQIVAWLDPGTYYVAVMENGQNATIANYTMIASAVPFRTLMDAYEDDSTVAQARSISTGGIAEQHNIHRPTDVDWFTFTLAERSRVTLETDGPEGNTWMALYAASNLSTPVASDSYSGNGDFSRIVQYLSAGTYYVRVQENYQDATIANYTMSVKAVPLTSLQDNKEPDDTSNASSPLIATDGTFQARSIHEPSDVDWARFTVSVPSKVVVQTDGAAGSTQMWLFGPNNWTSQIAYDAYSGKDDFSHIATTLQPGTYYVKVNENGMDQAIAAYYLSVFARPLTDLCDAYETDDSSAQAVLVPADGTRRMHNFHVATDVDWIAFDVTQRSKVVVQTDGAAGDTQLWLFAQGSYDWSNPLAYDDDGGSGSFSRIVAYLNPGRYYAATAEYGKNATIDDYTLAVMATPLASLADSAEAAGDNTASTATTLAIGAVTPAHSIHDLSDVDWFRFQVSVPSVVTLASSGPSSQDSESIRLQLFGPNTSTASIDYSTGSGANCQMQRVLQPGTYFVSVQESNNDQVMPQYTLSVTASPLGDLKVLSGALSAAGTVNLGQTIGVQWTAQNLGPGSTNPYHRSSSYWYDNVYLSLDNTLDSNDYSLGYWSSNGRVMEALGQYTGYRSITLPTDTKWAGRSAYILVAIDGDEDIAEANETNNLVAIPIQTSRYIALQGLYDGRFADARAPVEIGWLALDAQPGAVVSLAIDTDADPGNGGYQWLIQNQPVSAQRTVEKALLSLSGIAPRTEPYYVWAQVSDSLGSQYSVPVSIFVADRAFVSERGDSSAVGGGSYSVIGIEAAQLGDTYTIRVRTNFRPDGGSGGDLNIVSGGATYGLCVHSHTIADGTRVYAGDLYAGASFLQGTHVASVPTFINSYATRITEKTTVQVIETPNQPWNYEIIATMSSDAIPAAAQNGFSVGWAMYCGNDTDRVAVLPTPKPDIVAKGLALNGNDASVEFTYDIVGKNLSGSTHIAIYWADGDKAENRLGNPIVERTIASAVGSYGPITVSASQLTNPPPVPRICCSTPIRTIKLPSRMKATTFVH